MKNLKILSLIVFFSITGNIFPSDWNWQNPFPACVKFNSVKSINVNVVYACGEAGSIAKTTNGGVNWYLLNSGTSYDLNKIEFINEYTGWCVGGKELYSLIIKTTDGGLNWNSQLPPNDTSYVLKEVKFQNENTGWAGGGYYSGRSTMFKTTNSGLNWVRVNTGTNLWVYSIEFISAQTGFASGQNFVIKTTDSGSSWTQLSLPLTTYYDIEFIDDVTGWVSGNSIYKTVNSGNNWSSVFSTGYSSIDFVSPDTGFAISSSTNMRKTTNGGSNWIQNNTGYTESMLSVSFANSVTGWSVGWYGQLIKTTNAGENWISQKVDQIPGDINDICMKNNKLWIVTTNVNNTGSIYSSSDLGVTWNQDLYLPVIFTSVFFSSNDTGWALGYAVSGNQLKLFRTINAGANWESHSILPYFYSTGEILFIDSQTGFLTGTEWPGGFGRIFRTTNSGVNWVNVAGGERVNDIKFLNSNTGIAVGSNGTVLRSTNAGSNWYYAFTGVSYELRTLEFVDQNTGYAAGYGGIIRTTNRGISWEIQNSANSYHINTVKFLSPFSGLAAGFSGDILYTNNAGENWVHVPNFTYTGFTELLFINETTGWLTGGYGTLLKTTNSGGLLVGISGNNGITPYHFFLSQNYPNPFNPVTNIKFDIPKSGFVKLTVYDLLGREITRLVYEQMQPGSYNVDWDASNYPSGVYFYKIIVGDNTKNGGYTESKKMVLVK